MGRLDDIEARHPFAVDAEDVEWLVARVRELEGAAREVDRQAGNKVPWDTVGTGLALALSTLRAALADHLVKGESDG